MDLLFLFSRTVHDAPNGTVCAPRLSWQRSPIPNPVRLPADRSPRRPRHLCRHRNNIHGTHFCCVARFLPLPSSSLQLLLFLMAMLFEPVVCIPPVVRCCCSHIAPCVPPVFSACIIVYPLIAACYRRLLLVASSWWSVPCITAQ